MHRRLFTITGCIIKIDLDLALKYCMMPGKQNKYTVQFKLAVITFAENSNNSAAGQEYGVSEKLVRDWRKISTRILEMPKKRCADRGKMSKHPEMEKALADWVQESRQHGYIVTRGAICLNALKLAKQIGIKDFKASASWCMWFMKRHDFVLRQKIKIAQCLPRELDDKITSFQKFVIHHRQTNKYALACIGNMDETPITFDMLSNRTVNKIGEKTVLVKTTEHEKAKYTVALGCMAHGTKLKLMVIFKCKTMPNEKFPKGILVHVHPKGWMDEDGCNLWINKVWINCSGGLRKDKSLLVWDMFKTHMVDSVKKSSQTGKYRYGNHPWRPEKR